LREILSGVLNGTSYPNSFSGETTIAYTLTEAGRVTIDVYDLSGKVVKRLVNDETLPGSYSVTWDATNDNGSLVDGGFYFFKVRQGNQSVTEKMVLLR
jgi:flagellar hook assembly protein FlgD